MTQRTIETFTDEICSKPTKEIYLTYKADSYHIDNNWSLEKLDLKVYGPKNNRRYKYVSVLIDNFSNWYF